MLRWLLYNHMYMPCSIILLGARADVLRPVGGCRQATERHAAARAHRHLSIATFPSFCAICACKAARARAAVKGRWRRWRARNELQTLGAGACQPCSAGERIHPNRLAQSASAAHLQVRPPVGVVPRQQLPKVLLRLLRAPAAAAGAASPSAAAPAAGAAADIAAVAVAAPAARLDLA